MRLFQNGFSLMCAGLMLLATLTIAAQKLKPPTQSEQKELDRSLLAACDDADLPRDLPAIVKLLERGANIEATDSTGRTPLIMAARDSNGRLIDFLLTAGANPLAQNDEGYTVDFFVGVSNDTDGLSPAAKATLDLANKITAMPIREAAALRKVKTLEFIDAVLANDTEKALKLLYASRSTGSQGKQPSEAVYADYIDGRNSNATALMIASLKGNIELVTALLKENVRIDRYNSKHRTALHHALRTGKIEGVKLLLKAGADVDFADSDGVTPLLITAIQGDIESAKLLLENKANVNKASGESILTPLHMAIRAKHSALVPIFLKAGANPNVLAKYSVTPLMLAAQEGDDGAVISLLQNGANPNLKNSQGSAALDYAQQKNQPAIVKILTDGTYTKSEFKP